MLQLLVEEAHGSALGLQHVHEFVGGEHHGRNDQERAEDEGGQADPASPVEVGKDLRPVHFDDAHPGNVFLPGHGEDALPALLDADAVKGGDLSKR